jgi:UDP-N-acetylglucosamine transferase subunit ALG13
MFSMLRQMPKLLQTIRTEHEWLEEQVKKRVYDGIISDNRYGLFRSGIPSVIITHQLSVQTGLGKLANEMLRKLHYKFLERFDQCWIADAEKNCGLGGKLSHPGSLPGGARYIGLLSQFDPEHAVDEEHLLVLLSGPEPQRSILAARLWQQVQNYTGRVAFVEGSARAKRPDNIPAHIQWHGQLGTTELEPLLRGASMVICRSGYSTLMDLAALGKKAIVIPTPGQTEQKSLAAELHRRGVFFSDRQKNFDLKKALNNARLFPFKDMELQGAFNGYKTALEDWLNQL